MIKLRQVLGILGICLPILSLIFSFFGFHYLNQPIFIRNISATHYHNSYLFFEGILLSVGIFLLIYNGYDIKDKVITIIAGIGAIITCFFPCTDFLNSFNSPWNFLMMPTNITNILHIIGAVTFFACLFFMQVFQFTKTSGKETREKIIRNRLYIICGWITLLAVIICTPLNTLLLYLGINISLGPIGLEYFGETISLWSFGIAWLVKGETLLKDKI
jgi:uncharacterized membrane protein